jgi:predicted DCC family thiol-disulfide oxidoreductase YuxK
MALINYFSDGRRTTPLNLAVARVIVSAYTIWKMVSYFDWGIVVEWPVFLHSEYNALVLGESLWYLSYEKWLVIGLLFLFGFGYRTKWTGFLSALLIAHMSAHLNMVTTGGTSTTFLYPVYLLMLFALFDDYDHLSIEGLRRTNRKSRQNLENLLSSDNDRTYAMPQLKWSLVIFGLIYLQSGVAKIFEGPLLAWVGADNLQRYLILWQTISGRDLLLADTIAGSELLSASMAWGTVFLEVGFIFAILFGLTITPFILGLGAMHAGIAITMTPFFYDMFVIYLIFLPWDRIYGRLASTESVRIIYDPNCYFCVRSLQFVRWLDANDTIVFTPNTEYSGEEDIDTKSAMYLLTASEAYRGYDAFRELFARFGPFVMVSWLMRVPPVPRYGRRAYDKIAATRDQRFVCAVNTDD